MKQQRTQRTFSIAASFGWVRQRSMQAFHCKINTHTREWNEMKKKKTGTNSRVSTHVLCVYARTSISFSFCFMLFYTEPYTHMWKIFSVYFLDRTHLLLLLLCSLVHFGINVSWVCFFAHVIWCESLFGSWLIKEKILQMCMMFFTCATDWWLPAVQ